MIDTKKYIWMSSQLLSTLSNDGNSQGYKSTYIMSEKQRWRLYTFSSASFKWALEGTRISLCEDMIAASLNTI